MGGGEIFIQRSFELQKEPWFPQGRQEELALPGAVRDHTQWINGLQKSSDPGPWTLA